jgi:hypothetical protein
MWMNSTNCVLNLSKVYGFLSEYSEQRKYLMMNFILFCQLDLPPIAVLRERPLPWFDNDKL